MAYIANRPVRFDRDYAIGEIIPTAVIDPRMVKKLTDMGKIIRTDIPEGEGAGETPNTHADPPNFATEGDNEGGAINSTQEEENADTGQNEGDSEGDNEDGAAENRCEVCGKTFKNKIALAAHMRSHKE